jgi:hypothetical protein
LIVFFPGRRIQAGPVVYKKPGADAVDSEWINKKMLETETSTKQIAADTGLHITQLTSLVTGSRPLSQPMKALFWYYFLSKQPARA